MPRELVKYSQWILRLGANPRLQTVWEGFDLKPRAVLRLCRSGSEHICGEGIEWWVGLVLRNYSTESDGWAMSKGMRIASWVLAITTVVFCDAVFVVMFILTMLEESSGLIWSAIEDVLSDVLIPIFWVGIPLLQIACLVFAILAAARKAPEIMRTSRAIMLTFKLGLIPFFIGGALVELAFFALGFHPVMPGFGWVLAFAVAILGWFSMLPGSVWAMATAIHLRRRGLISAGEMAAHIVLQLFFVADVVDAVILFARSSEPKTTEPQTTPQISA